MLWQEVGSQQCLVNAWRWGLTASASVLVGDTLVEIM